MSSPADEHLIRRAAREIGPAMVVNLGIGLPQRIIDHLDLDAGTCFLSENGIAGVGPTLPHDRADRNLIDAGGLYVSTVPGGSFFDSAVSFAMIRGGRVDLAVLGALQVGANGDLANWTIPGRFTPGVGGATELAEKARRVVVVTSHRDRYGRSKIVERCSLPLTAPTCVDRIITDLAVLDVVDQRLILRELGEGCSVETLLEATEAHVEVGPARLPSF